MLRNNLIHRAGASSFAALTFGLLAVVPAAGAAASFTPAAGSNANASSSSKSGTYTAKPMPTYAECLAKVSASKKKVTPLSATQQKKLTPLLETVKARSAKLSDSVTKLRSEHQQVVTDALKTDTDFYSSIDPSTITDAVSYQKAQCQAVYKLQFRAQQISELHYIDAHYKRDNTLFKVMSDPASTTYQNITNPLKSDMSTAVQLAVGLLKQNIDAEDTAANIVMQAQLDENYVSNLPAKPLPDSVANYYNIASWNRHRVLAIKKAGSTFQPTAQVKVDTSTLFDAQGNNVSEGGKNAVKAEINVVSLTNNKNSRTITLTRDNYTSPWKVAKKGAYTPSKPASSASFNQAN